MNGFRIALLVPMPLIIDLATKLEVSGVRVSLLITGALGLAYSVEILRSGISSAGGSFLVSAFIFLSLMAFIKSGTFMISIFLGFVISFVLATLLISSKIPGYTIKLVNLAFSGLFIFLVIFRSSLSAPLFEQIIALLFLFWYYAFVFNLKRLSSKPINSH
ncbi:MAG: hypothetical protein ACK401_05535 [Archaeoglobaceae archaeon]